MQHRKSVDGFAHVGGASEQIHFCRQTLGGGS